MLRNLVEVNKTEQKLPNIRVRGNGIVTKYDKYKTSVTSVYYQHVHNNVLCRFNVNWEQVKLKTALIIPITLSGNVSKLKIYGFLGMVSPLNLLRDNF